MHMNIRLIILFIVVPVLALIYVFAIAGRRRRPDAPDFFRRLYAHRGLFSPQAQNKVPENSLAAFRLAVEHGFGIELDVHVSADGELFVFHDDTLSRACGENVSVTSLTYDELSSRSLFGSNEHIPLFSDVLKLIGGKVPLIVEVKCAPREPVAPVCERVKHMLDGYSGAYVIESFNPGVVHWFRKNAPYVFRGQLSEQFFTPGHRDPARFALHHLLVNVLGRPDFVAYNCRHRRALAFRIWRRLYRMPAAGWTVRDADTMRTLIREDAYDCLIFEGFVPDETSF